ncbi:MAG: type II toxin-antitoxin system RelE/ParE family toxin [Gemmobacter sp.]
MPSAVAALAEIHTRISADNPVAADVLRDRALSYVETKLAVHPLIGRPGRVDGTRESVIHASYTIVYRVTADRIEVLAVRHVAPSWPRAF